MSKQDTTIIDHLTRLYEEHTKAIDKQQEVIAAVNKLTSEVYILQRDLDTAIDDQDYLRKHMNRQEKTLEELSQRYTYDEAINPDENIAKWNKETEERFPQGTLYDLEKLEMRLSEREGVDLEGAIYKIVAHLFVLHHNHLHLTRGYRTYGKHINRLRERLNRLRYQMEKW